MIVVSGFYGLSALMALTPIIMIIYYNDERRQIKQKLLTPYFIWLPLWVIYIGTVSFLGLLDGFELPPKIAVFIILPALLSIILFQRVIINHGEKLSLQFTTYIQSFRILVELLIFGGYVHGVFPQLLTFEGQNMDMLVGFSAPIIGFLYSKKILPKKGLLAWNIISLSVLIHTIATFIRSFYVLDLFTLEAAAKFVRFPYLLLPALLAPMAIFYHILSIRMIIRKG